MALMDWRNCGVQMQEKLKFFIQYDGIIVNKFSLSLMG